MSEEALSVEDLDLEMDPHPDRLSPTEEQQAILEAARKGGSLLIEAMAGCSKTSTIEILIRALPKRPCAYVVFNKRNKIEAEKKFASESGPWSYLGSASHCSVVTLNGLGHNAWSRAIGKRLNLQTNKLRDILRQKLREDKRPADLDDFTTILALVRRARIVGLIPSHFPKKGPVSDTEAAWKAIGEALWLDSLSEEHFYYARQVLIESVRQSYAGLIDFDDQIYMSALFGGVFPRFPLLFGDEVQDYSPLNQQQIARAAAGDLILVGDPRQAIYAFRGADSDSIGSLRSLRPSWTDLPLSTTFRCPKAIVERQQSHAPGFTAWHTNPEGKVLNLVGKPWKIPDGKVAILCRNNAPLFSVALKCIKAGRGCAILGGEIGRGLISLAKKLAGESDLRSVAITDFVQKLLDWEQEETQKALINQQESKAALISDKADCIRVLLGEASTVYDIVNQLEFLFTPENMLITLSTGHKAKGLEWPTVVHLDPWRIPSKYARDQALSGNTTSLDQEMNLKYVIETRAQETLILANKDDLQ